VCACVCVCVCAEISAAQVFVCFTSACTHSHAGVLLVRLLLSEFQNRDACRWLSNKSQPSSSTSQAFVRAQLHREALLLVY